MQNIYTEIFSYRFYSRQLRLTMNDRNPSLNVKKLFEWEYFEYNKKFSSSTILCLGYVLTDKSIDFHSSIN